MFILLSTFCYLVFIPHMTSFYLITIISQYLTISQQIFPQSDMNQVISGLETYQHKIDSLKSLKKTKSIFLRWDDNSKKWKHAQQQKIPKIYKQDGIRTLSFNVLFDRLHLVNKKGSMEHVLNSKQRYAHILQQIQALKPDIVGLQQVTTCFFDMLLECEWARKQYWVSNFYSQNLSFGNILLSRIQPICIQSIKVKRLPRIVETGFFAISPKGSQQVNIVAFSSVHLIALDKNFSIRVQQLTNLAKQLKRFEDVVSDYVIQGDMNFHAEFQTENALKLNFKDCWLGKYSNLKENPGYTFDANKNNLINEIYWGFEKRRMRLDRIFYLANCFEVEKIQIVFNEGIHQKQSEVNHHMAIKGGFLFVSDYFGWNFHKQKNSFLFPSDHFGLLADIKIKTKLQQPQKNYIKI